MEKLIARWNEEWKAAWLAGHDNLDNWLSDDERKHFRRAALRYLRRGVFADAEQRAAIIRIIENTIK